MNSAGDDVPVFQQRQWIIGMSFIVCGSLIDFASFGLAPQSLLAPLAALTLIWNLLLARQYLGETFGHAELRATALIFFGAFRTQKNLPELPVSTQGVLQERRWHDTMRRPTTNNTRSPANLNRPCLCVCGCIIQAQCSW